MASFSWDTTTPPYGGSAFVSTAGWGWYNLANESFPSAELAANGRRPILVNSVSFLGGGSGGKVAKFDAGDGAGERTSGLVSNPSTFRFVVRATAGGTTTFLRNTGATGSIHATNTSDTLSGQLPGTINYSEVPTAPTITDIVQASLTEAQVEWSAPSDNGGSAITGYRVDWSTVSDFSSDVNTSSVGAVLSTTVGGIDPGATIYVRVAAINAVASAASTTSVFSSTDSLIMVAAVGDVDGWASYGTDPSGVTPLVTGGIRRGEVTPLGDGTTGLIREYTRTGTGGPTTAGARGIQRTFTGLTIGETYRLNGTALSMSATTPSTTTYRWAVTTIGNGSYGTISDDVTPATIPEYEFVATATSHVVQIQAGAASWTTAGYFEQVAFYGISLTYVPNPTDFFCQDVELESSLANHYTVACATLGAAWWVGADNVTRFRQADDTPGIIATFSDVTADDTIPYTDVAVSQSTKNIANILTITNYGVGSDVTTTFTEDDSIAAWGPREARLSLSLYDGPTYLSDRADEVFTRMSVPHRQITSVTFNAQQDLSVVQQLEIQSRVAVTFEGVTDTLRVVGIRHDITADQWLVTLDLSVWGYPEATSSGIGISDLSDHTVTTSELDEALATVALGTDDLDDIVETGNYYQDTAANATLARDYPIATVEGILEVVAGTGIIAQRFTALDVNATRIYTRVYDGSAWQLWRQVDLPAGGGDTALAASGTGSSITADPIKGVVTFSAATVITVDQAFSGAFRNYEIDIESIGTAATMIMVLRTAVPGDITSGYDRTEILARNGTVSSSTSLNGSSWSINGASNTIHQAKITLARPNVQLETSGLSLSGVHADPAVQNTSNLALVQYLTQRADTICEGFKITFSANQTGTITIRGIA